MIRYIVLFFVLFMNKNIHAQQANESVTGFYDMSSFEKASGMFLFEDQTFFFYASFGNADLKIYGNYKIENDSILTFEPHKDLMQAFYAYGTNTNLQNDSILLNYQRPYDESFNSLAVNTVSFPEFDDDDDLVSISIPKPKSNLLNLDYSNRHDEIEQLTFQLVNNEDEVLIFHNYYAYLVNDFSLVFFTIYDDHLMENNQEIKKEEISEEVIQEIKTFVESRKNKNTLNRNGKTYQKLKTVSN